MVRFGVQLSHYSLSFFLAQTSLQTKKWLNNWYLAGPFPLDESLDENQHLPGFETDFLFKMVVKQILGLKKVTYKIGWGNLKMDETRRFRLYIDLDNLVSKKSYVAA